MPATQNPPAFEGPVVAPTSTPTAFAAETTAAARPGEAPIPSSVSAPIQGLRRWALWSVLVALLAIGQTLLVLLTLRYEDSEAIDRAESAAMSVAQDVRRAMILRMQAAQTLQWPLEDAAAWRREGAALMRQYREIGRLERRDAQGRILEAVDNPLNPPLFAHVQRPDLRSDSDQACTAAQRLLSPQFSRSYFVPLAGGAGLEVIELCLPQQVEGRTVGSLVATLPLVALLESVARADNRYELSFVEPDGTRLARYGAVRGSGQYTVRRVLELPGTGLEIKVDDTQGRPGLLPNLTTALVLGLSIALTVVVALLLRDMRRRTRAEAALAESLAFRKAMEDSLITGLRARDLAGRITYVNPAFCRMVGRSASELLGTGSVDGAYPPYWPPEQVEDYRRRQIARHARTAGEASGASAALEGFETVFARADGERFPVLIYEAPLVDGHGQQTGWMSAVLDVSEQRRGEEQARLQQDRLQATARLATMGEMASLLSHELNQPLAAIASYAGGSLNLLREPDEHTVPLLREAVERMAEQADRAGRVIKSVHDFVRRREQPREAIAVGVLLDGVLPLVRLQARKSATEIELVMADPSLRIQADRTMLEQVLLNLTRNGIQAMERVTPAGGRRLTIAVRNAAPGRVQFEVTDRGPGIDPEVAARLFTPFFTTREDGMGLGLSLCRTVVEQHGGSLEHDTPDNGLGCRFRFTVPAASTAKGR